ncbi:MAG: hypothetical protein QXR87_06960 [Candidatus Hadarchaeales archaeon]
MGVARYYLLATFRSEREAHRAYLCAKAVLADLAEFYDDWQKVRHEKGTAQERFRRLLRRHPLVAKFVELPKPPKNDPAMNFLAGHCEITQGMTMELHEHEIWLTDMVWHCASWRNIARLFYQLGAVRVAWMSEEDFDPWELLSERYEEKKVDKLPDKVIKEELLPKALAREL